MSTLELAEQIAGLRLARVPENWRAEAGPAVAAACLHATDRSSGVNLSGAAVYTLHRLIVQHDAENYRGGDGNITAMFFGTHLAQALLVLRSTQSLSVAEDALWLATLRKIGRQVVVDGETRWHGNGNLAAGYWLLMSLLAKIDGDDWDPDVLEAAVTALRPDPVKFRGMGLRLDDDGGAYLAERGRPHDGDGFGPAGFDPDYAMLTASQVTRGYVLTGSPVFLVLARQLWAYLAPRIDDAGTIDMSVGTRHPHPGARWQVGSCIVPVMAQLGDPRAQQLAAGWWARSLDPRRYPATMNAGGHYVLGLDLGTALLARSGWPLT